MGLIAMPVAKAGLSTLLGQDDAEPEENVDSSALDALMEKLRQLQQLLSVPVTGKFDDATREAVKGVQGAYGLEQTGNPMDPQTKGVLEQMGADLSSLTPTEYARINLQAWWTGYKWWILAGGAVVVGGGALLLAGRKRRA